MPISKNLKKTLFVGASALMMLSVGGGAVNAMHSNVHADSWWTAMENDKDNSHMSDPDHMFGGHPNHKEINREKHEGHNVDPNKFIVPANEDDGTTNDNGSQSTQPTTPTVQPTNHHKSVQPKRHEPVQPEHHANNDTHAKNNDATRKSHKVIPKTHKVTRKRRNTRKPKTESLTDQINRLTKELNELENQDSRINDNTRTGRHIRKHARKVARHARRAIRQYYLD